MLTTLTSSAIVMCFWMKSNDSRLVVFCNGILSSMNLKQSTPTYTEEIFVMLSNGGKHANSAHCWVMQKTWHGESNLLNIIRTCHSTCSQSFTFSIKLLYTNDWQLLINKRSYEHLNWNAPKLWPDHMPGLLIWDSTLHIPDVPIWLFSPVNRPHNYKYASLIVDWRNLPLCNHSDPVPEWLLDRASDSGAVWYPSAAGVQSVCVCVGPDAAKPDRLRQECHRFILLCVDRDRWPDLTSIGAS